MAGFKTIGKKYVDVDNHMALTYRYTCATKIHFSCSQKGTEFKIPYFFEDSNLASISHDGVVSKSIPLSLVSSCDIDISYFPFDEQSCPMNVSSQ